MKKFICLLLTCFLLLCTASAGYCSGTLDEQDAFDTYIGKSKSVVRVIAPNYKEVKGTDFFIVDRVEYVNDGYAALFVDFEDTNTVQAVGLMMDPNTAELAFDGDIFKFFSYSLSAFGLDAANLTEVHRLDENYVYGIFVSNILCTCRVVDIAYTTDCHQY